MAEKEHHVQLLDKANQMISELSNQVKHLEQRLKQVTLGAGVEATETKAIEKEKEKELERTEKTRMTKSSGKDISELEGRIGGPFTVKENPEFLKERLEIFERLYKVQQSKLAAKERVPIIITLPDGSIKNGTAWETSPLDIARGISEGLAKNVIIAKVAYSRRFGEKVAISSGQEEFDQAAEEMLESKSEADRSELWDLSRPLEGDCSLHLLKFDEPEAKMVFWHSSAHVLGQCLECNLGSYLTVGPPVNPGFYYDSYIGEHGISEKTLKDLADFGLKKAKEKQLFERLVLTKEEALEMFKYNPYKVSIIRNKVKDGTLTSVYRNGPFVDLCMGPHIVDTGSIKALELKQATTAYWLGNENNDKLQRVHGISFPDKKLLKEYKQLIKKAEENDHRKKGKEQNLFMFHDLSPGCAFWTEYGGKIYTKLVGYMQQENRKRHYTEVVTPNVFSVDLWKISGHWEHYKKDMFVFSDGEQKLNNESNLFALKPMNCPGHCLIFDSRVRSYRDLPIRLSDFGVLHRNEASGALSGLTRVRRFQQDDAHIFCRLDQVKTEVLNCLHFIQEVYGKLGLRLKLGRSTRPKKACGLVDENGKPDLNGIRLWDLAEASLGEALDEFVGRGNWKDNKGDGAFYGPKIDVEVFDALKRKHQCATVQLDFQLPIRFKLKYKSDHTHIEGDGDQGTESSYEKPVIIHRAILGSIERMTGILTEHFGGKWPLWLSPRQVMVIPVSNAEELNTYAESVCKRLFEDGFDAEVDVSSKTLNKKILLAQKEQFNYMFIIGKTEMENGSVNVRTRRNNKLGELLLVDAVNLMKGYIANKSLDDVVDPTPEKEEEQEA